MRNGKLCVMHDQHWKIINLGVGGNVNNFFEFYDFMKNEKILDFHKT